MFWKKRTYSDDIFGPLSYSSKSWFTEKHLFENEEIGISVGGTKIAPDEKMLIIAKKIVSDLKSLKQIAIKYINEQDISDFTENNGDLVFDGLDVYKDDGSFDLGFGLSEWPDASIIVHFKENAPYEISLGH